jgi:4-hydroxybenzoate polyprenyltransferase
VSTRPVGRLRTLFELVRLPNIFTAPADVVMGMSVSGASLGAAALPLLAASAFAYAGGMALNDAWDAPLDARERPGRPIPSGRITRASAFTVAGGCFILCVGLAALAGSAPLVVALALVGAIVAYDGFAKGSAVGPASMAACRVLNVGLGTAVGTIGGRAAGAMGLLFAYVFVLTVLSRFEVMTAPVALVRAGALAFGAVLALSAALIIGWWGRAGAVGILFLAALAVWLGGPLRSALSEPSPPRIIAVIKAAVLGIILFDAAWAAGARSPAVGLAIALLFVPALVLGRRFASA